MPFIPNITSSLPILNNNRGLEEINKVTPFLRNLNENWTNWKDYITRNAGVGGLNSENIGLAQVKAQNIAFSQKQKLLNSDINISTSSETLILHSDPVNITSDLIDSAVLINFQASWQTNHSANTGQTYFVVIKKFFNSTAGTAISLVGAGGAKKTWSNQANLHNNYDTLSLSYLDTQPKAVGDYYYSMYITGIAGLPFVVSKDLSKIYRIVTKQ